MINNYLHVHNETKAREKEPSYTDLICASLTIDFISVSGKKLYEKINFANGHLDMGEIAAAIARVEKMHKYPLRMWDHTRELLQIPHDRLPRTTTRGPDNDTDPLNELDRK